MPNPTDIELSVGLSTDDVKKSAKDLQNSIRNIFDKSSGKELDKNLENIKKQMSASAVKTNQLMEQLRKLESIKIPTQEYKEVSAQIAKAEAQLNKLRDMEEKFAETGKKISPQKMRDMQYAAAELENTIEYAKGELQDLVDTGNAFTLGSDTEQYSKIADNLANVNNQQRLNILRWYEQADAQDKAGASANRLKNIMSLLTTIMRKLGSSIRQTFKDMINIFKRAASYAKNFASAIASIPSHFKKANNSHMDFNKGLKKGITTILKYGFGIRSLYILFRKLKVAMADGIKSVVLWEGENGRLNQSISSMLSAVNTLKNSIGAMVTPLINSLAPAITRIIDLINAAIQKIAQFIAALTGQKTFLVAEKVQSNYAKSLDKTAGSANKAKKALDGYLGSFDELNNVNSKNDSDSGSGGGAGTGTFKEMPIDPKILDFIDKLKKMWEDKDFYDLGKQIGEKLRDVLESIPWDKIRQTSNDLGKCLATLINGFVEVERLAFDIGYTVAQGVNTVFEFINGFVHNLHWDSVGEFIADMFNGFFETIDWELIKDTVVTGLQGIAEAINSFIETFHWDNISNFISNAVNTITAGIYEFFTTVNWVDLGKNIGQQLMESIRKINWQDIGKAIGSILQSAITFVHNFIKQLDAKDIVQALTDMINGFFDEVDTEELGETIANIIDLAIDVAKGFWEKNKDTLKEEGKKLFKGFFDNVDKEDLMETVGGILKTVILVGIARAIPSILATVAKFALGKLILGKILEGAGAAGGAGGASSLATIIIPRLVYLMQEIEAFLASSVGALLTNLVAGIVSFFVGAEIGKKIGAWIFPDDKDLYEHYSGIKGTLELVRDTAVTLAERTAEHVSDAWDNIKEAAKVLGERTKEHLGKAADWIKEKWNSLKEWFNSVWGTISDWFKTYVTEPIKMAFSDAWTAITNVWNGIKEFFQPLGEFLVSLWEGVTSRVSKFFEGCWIIIKAVWIIVSEWFDENVIQPLQLVWQDFTDVLQKLWNTVVEFVKKIWNDCVSWIKTNIIQPLQMAWDDLSKKIQEAWNTAVEFVKKIWNDLVTNIKQLWTTFYNWLKSSIIEPIKKAWDTLCTTVATYWNSLVTKVKSIWTSCKSWFDTTIIQPLKSAFNTMCEAISGFFNAMWTKIKDGAKSAINWVITKIENGINGMIDGVNKFFDLFNGAVEWAADITGESWSGIELIKHVSLPKLAQGAVIPPNKEFLAVLGDQKSGVNIETPLDTMIEAFNAANRGGNEAELRLLQEQNDLLRQLLQKEFGISERQIYNSVINQDNIRRKSTGYSAFAY